MTEELEYHDEAVESFREFLREMRDSAPGEYGYGEFRIADGVTVECDWALEDEEMGLSVGILVHGEGFGLFTRSVEDTLADTGALGHGPNHGDTISADVAGWIAKNFTDSFDEIVFEHHTGYNGDGWLFIGSIPNPKWRPPE